ncbi:aminotransferase-like domain-containing protein [Massilia endophytica]|uniref:aminotransferase-like domain-containing protein n=1 Tax=Massilia endophytica TaxID=2899220 RepID=UPI001E3D1D75|nr:PLP-dependent aminotransferase family protein [Massilia endophytica]UGQ46363.1 PLP-dependent aminotransferase family protein [Massilia endophytica]
MPKNRYKQLVDHFSSAIQRGELRPGEQLPPLRRMMKERGIALATAVRVYAELEKSGLAVGEGGRGTFVRDASLPRGLGLEQHPLPSGAVDLSFNYPSLPGQAEMLREGLRTLANSGDLDALLHSAPQGGRPHERETVARHLRNRSIRVPGRQVLIVNGAQQGLSVAVSALLKPGDLLAADALTYPGLKALAIASRLDLAALPAAGGGMCLDSLEKLCMERPVRAVYAMPTMHNPLGWIMTDQDRLRLAALAERFGFFIIEDGAYAFLAEPAPKPVFTYAPERTVYVSGLSKSVASGLRLGFVAAPEALIPELEHAIRISTWNTPSMTVALACQWIESGLVDELEERKRADAAARQRLARKILDGAAVRSHPSSYFLWLELPDYLRADVVAADLQRSGVLVTTAEPFSIGLQSPQALRIALGSISLEALEGALRLVGKAVGLH